MTSGRKTAKRILITDTAVAPDWDVHVHVHGARGRHNPDRYSMYGIELRGELASGLGGVKALLVRLGERADKELIGAKAVGAVVGVKPEIAMVVDLSEREFAGALALVASGKPVHIHTSFEKPRYGISSILSFSISSKPIE